MKITLLTVGKTDRDWVKQGLDIYVSRLKHYIPFSIVEIPELKNVSALTKEQIKTREGELILKNLRPTDDVILLDERGKEYSSVELAKVIQDKISYEGKDIVYIIGGARVYNEAIDYVQKLELTLILTTSEADAYFPDFTRFLKLNESDLHFQNEIYYKFATYCLPITTSNPINYYSI